MLVQKFVTLVNKGFGDDLRCHGDSFLKVLHEFDRETSRVKVAFAAFKEHFREEVVDSDLSVSIVSSIGRLESLDDLVRDESDGETVSLLMG